MGFRHQFKPLKIKPKQQSALIDFIEGAPEETLREIFNRLPLADVLNCRLLCRTMLIKIDANGYSKDLKVVLEGENTPKDKKPQFNSVKTVRHLSSPRVASQLENLLVRNLLTTRISRNYVKNSFYWVRSVEICGQIKTSTFLLLAQEIPCLANFRVHSLTLGGPLSLTQANLSNKTSPIKNLDLILDFVPCSMTTTFSPSRLVTNLLLLKFWDLPYLSTISFLIKTSTLNEQFYFGLDTLISSIPITSYNSLKVLKVNSSKLKSTSLAAKVSILNTLQKISIQNSRLLVTLESKNTELPVPGN